MLFHMQLPRPRPEPLESPPHVCFWPALSGTWKPGFGERKLDPEALASQGSRLCVA